MNDDLQPDPELESFAARLAARRPQISSQQRDTMFYASAFTSGRNAAARSLRIWRTAAAVLSVLLVGAVISPMQPPQIVDRRDEPAAPVDVTPPQQSEDATPVALARTPVAVNLDAWQVPSPPDEKLSKQLAEWSQSDPHVRSQTVSSLTRRFLNSEHTDSL